MRINDYISNHIPSAKGWRGATLGVFVAAILLGITSTIGQINSNVSLGAASAYFAVGSLITALIGAALVFMWMVVAKLPSAYIWAVASFAFIVYYFFIPNQTTLGISLLALWTLVSFSLVGGALWVLLADLFSKKREGLLTPTIVLLLGMASLATMAWWLQANNTPFTPPEEYPGTHTPTAIGLTDPGQPGSLSVKRLTYGSGKANNRPEYGPAATLITPTVDATAFIDGWEGLSGWLHTHYWGFDVSEVPLNALVWYPEGPGPYPLVLLVHGQHSMESSSEKGYAYLAELFASRGFIAVSIDENFLNTSGVDLTEDLNELPARGWLILEHLKLWREWNQSEGNPLFKKVDMQRIALIGHSRGGEAVVTAAAFNRLSRFPGNGSITFDYNFNIQALGAIAPVSSQYTPGGLVKALDNIDYFTLHGSHDGDVRSFGGSAQYRRIKFTKGSPYHFKAALYIYGANHGQFNTIWGNKDLWPPSIELFALNQMIPLEQQKQIAKVYLSAFLEASLLGKKEYLPLFQSYRSGSAWLPKTLYLNEFADSNQVDIVSEPTGIDITKTQLSGGTLQGDNLRIWRQQRIVMREGTLLLKGIVLGWGKEQEGDTPASYTITLPKKGLKVTEDSTLVLSVANYAAEDKALTAEERKSPIDFTISLTDGQGNTASLPLSYYAYLNPVIELHLMKHDLLDPLLEGDVIFQTFDFPLMAFAAENQSFNPASLKSIQLIFNKTPQGSIVLNTVAIRG